MGIDIDSWRCRIGHSGNLLNAIGIRKYKLRETLYDFMMTKHRQRTTRTHFWMGVFFVITLMVVYVASGKILLRVLFYFYSKIGFLIYFGQIMTLDHMYIAY